MTPDLVPLRRLSRFAYGEALATDVRVDGHVPVMSSGGVTGTHDRANTQSPAIVIGRKGSHGSVHWSDERAFVIDTAYYVDRTHTAQDLRWLYYVLTSANLARLSQDVGVPGLSRERAYEAEMPFVRDLREQRRIADFLDDQVSRIDDLIGARARAIDLMVERQRSVTEALVWGGVGPHALTPTGIGPAPLAPSHWRRLRNKVLLRESRDLSRFGDEELLSVSHLTGVSPRSEKSVNMFMAESMEGYRIVHTGDLVINTLWAWMGALGVSNDDGIVSPAYGVPSAGPRCI